MPGSKIRTLQGQLFTATVDTEEKEEEEVESEGEFIGLTNPSNPDVDTASKRMQDYNYRTHLSTSIGSCAGRCNV